MIFMSVTTNIDVLLKNCYIYYYKYEIAVMLCVAKLFWILTILKTKMTTVWFSLHLWPVNAQVAPTAPSYYNSPSNHPIAHNKCSSFDFSLLFGLCLATFSIQLILLLCSTLYVQLLLLCSNSNIRLRLNIPNNFFRIFLSIIRALV